MTVRYLDIGMRSRVAFRPQNVPVEHPVPSGPLRAAGSADNEARHPLESSARPELSGRTVPEGVIIATLPIRDYRYSLVQRMGTCRKSD